MLFLVLGMGKTGSLVAEVARERGHSVRAMDINENSGATGLTPPTLAGVDAVDRFHQRRGRGGEHAGCAVDRLPHGGRHHRLVSASRRNEDDRRAPRRIAAVWDQLLHRRPEAVPADCRTCEARRLTSFR